MINLADIEDPTPDGKLREDLVEHLVKQVHNVDDRKDRARRRWMICTEAHKPLIHERLWTTLTDETYRDEVAKHVDVSDNPALDAIHDTCVVWSQGPQRTIAGATDAEASAFNSLVVESLIDAYAQTWNELAEFVGPLIVVPAIRKASLRWDVLLPTFYEVVPDPDDYYGTPLAVAYPIRGTKRGPGEEHDVMILDGVGWRRMSKRNGKLDQVGETVEHGLGRFPGAPLRFDVPIDCEWHGHPTRNQRFVDATTAVGSIKSVLSVTRKAQNGKLLAIIGYLGDAVKQQTADPEMGIAINVEGTNNKTTPTVAAHDFDTPPANSIAHANDYRRGVASAYGGTIAPDGRMVFDDAALAECRRRQLPRARAFCRELWINAVELCKRMNHPLATALPDVEKVRGGFAVDFGTLSRTFADPSEEAKHTDWLLSKAAIDELDITRKQGNENLDREQLKKRVEEKLANRAWFNDAVTKRNLSMVAGGAATAPQAFGALGPMVRDAKRDAPEGADDKPEGTEDDDRSDDR